MNEFEENNPEQLREFLRQLRKLVDDFHPNIYLLDEVFVGLDQIEAAIKDKLNNEKNKTRTTNY